MAKKIKFNKINGNDTIANSIKTLNQNFELLEDTLETQISKGVSSLQVDDVEWNTSGTKGPTSQIKLSNGSTAEIKPIPSADESQSGVVTIGEQTIAGVKTFKNGIITDTITDKKHHNIIVADGNTVYVGGNGGIKLIYDNNGNLSGVEYGFLKGVDLSQIVTQGNDSAKALESLRNYLESVKSEFNAKFDATDKALSNAQSAINDINDDNIFSVFEKRDFLNNTWRKIAGSTKFNPNLKTIDGNGHPVSNYLGTGSNGSFWILVKDLDLRLSSNSNIVNKFKRLGTICNHFGLFNAQLQNSNFGTGVGDDYNANDLYDALFEYYNEEELIRKNVYTASVNETLDALRNQIDGKISTFYGEGLPPSTQQGLSAYWEDANENHINDEYKDIRSTDNGGGKTYIFVAKTSETIITESDVEISEINYYWKGIDSSNISNIISQLEEAYNNVLAEMDGVIQIFGEADLPDEYNYGDIWFFGGIDKIQHPKKNDYDLSSFVVGNIYYCEGVYGGSEKGLTPFNPKDWKVGSNAGDTTQKFAHMTSDDWLSVTEKQQLLDDWYEITGVNLSEVTNVNTLIQTINAKQNNRSSYSTTIQKYNEIIEEYNSHIDNGGDVGGGNTIGGDVGGGDVSVKPAEPTSIIFENTSYFNGTKDKDVTKTVKPSIIIEENTVKLDFSKSDYYIAGYYLDGVEKMIYPDINCKSITLNKDSGKVSSVYIFKITTFDNKTQEKINVNISIESTSYTSDKNGVKITLLQDIYKQIEQVYTEDGKAINVVNGVEFEYDFSNEIPSEIKIYLSTVESHSSDIETTKTNLENSLKDIYEILVACGCREYILSDSDLRELNIPSGLSQNYGTGKFSSKPTILSDVFNRYYAEEKNLIVELTDLQVVNTVTTDPITVKELAEGVGGRGFVLSSLIQLEYNNTVIGGLDGVTEDGNGGFDNVGMWFGGTVENAKKTLNGTLNDESPVPVIITKNGINSKIGPFKIGNSTTNEHIYIGDNTTGNTTVIGKDYISMGASYVNSDTKSVASENATIFLDINGEGSKIGPLKIGSTIYIGNEDSGNVTVIHNDYISMGATYVNSNTKENAQQNSMIYLDKDGEGSRIGPLKIKKDSNNKILTFGNTTQVYSFKNTNDYTVSLGTRTEKTIDGYTFSNNELNKVIQYGTTIEDFKNIPVSPKDNFDHEMLPSVPRP